MVVIAASMECLAAAAAQNAATSATDAIADALNVAANTANISDPNELRASIAKQIRAMG